MKILFRESVLKVNQMKFSLCDLVLFLKYTRSQVHGKCGNKFIDVFVMILKHYVCVRG